MQKDFNSWNNLKTQLDESHNIPTFKELEIWWCSIGVNVGHEQNGKNRHFNRPVLVIKKFNKHLFWGVPLSTQIKYSEHYYKFSIKNKDQCTMLTQIRTWDAARLTHKMERLPEKNFKEIRNKLINYLK